MVWLRILEDACKNDKELQEIIGDSVGNAEEMRKRVLLQDLYTFCIVAKSIPIVLNIYDFTGYENYVII